MVRQNFPEEVIYGSRAASVASASTRIGYLLITRLRMLAERMWTSPKYDTVLLLLSAFFLLLNKPLEGVAFLSLAASFMLVFCSDFLALFTPFILACVLSCGFYEKYSSLLRYEGVFVLAFFALVAHFLLYRAPFQSGKMTLPLAAVSVATLFGGIGRITLPSYFSGVSLYYMLGLGAAMLLLYTVLLSRFRMRRSYNLLSRFLRILYIGGLFAGLVIVNTYFVRIDEVIAARSSIFIPYRNFCTTVLLLALPSTLAFPKDDRVTPFRIAFLYVSLLLTASRTALIFGTLELIACLVYRYVKSDSERRRRIRKVSVCVAPVLLLACAAFVQFIYTSRLIDGCFISPNDSRYFFLKLGLTDFLDAPLFGQGLGNMKNGTVYYGVEGSLVWYHNIVAQVAGSLGLCGLASYGYLWYTRAKLFTTKRSSDLVPALIAWLGIVAADMTNPGEICPFPNAFLVVALFAIIELLPNKKENGIR